MLEILRSSYNLIICKMLNACYGIDVILV